MTSASEGPKDAAQLNAPSNEPLAGAGRGASASGDGSESTSTAAPLGSATALRGRSNVYEKYLNQRLVTDPGAGHEEELTAMGKRLQAAASHVTEISNSNDDVELEAGEVVSDDVACAEDASGRGRENQENAPPTMNESLAVAEYVAEIRHSPQKPLMRSNVNRSVNAMVTATTTTTAPGSPLSSPAACEAALAPRDEKLTAAASCSPSAVDVAPTSIHAPETAVKPDDEPMPARDDDPTPLSASAPLPEPVDVPETVALIATPTDSTPTPAVAAPMIADADPSNATATAADVTVVVDVTDLGSVAVAAAVTHASPAVATSTPRAAIATIDLTADPSDLVTPNSTLVTDLSSSPNRSPRPTVRIDPKQYASLRERGQLRRDFPPAEKNNHEDPRPRPDWQSPPRGYNDRREGGPSGPDGPGSPGPRRRPSRDQSRSRSPRRNGPPMNGHLNGPRDLRNGPPSPRRFEPNGGFRGNNGPPRNNFGPPNGEFRGRSLPRDYRGRPNSPPRGPGPNGGPPFGRDGGSREPMGPGPGPSRRRSRSRSPMRGPGGPGGTGPRSPMRNGLSGGPDRNFRGSSPRNGGRFSPHFCPHGGLPPGMGRPGSPRGSMMGPPRSPPRGGRPPPDYMIYRPSGSPRGNMMGSPRSPPRGGGPPPGHMMNRPPGSPRGNFMGRPGSPRRGGPPLGYMMGRPGSPGRPGPGRSPPRDGFRGPLPNMMHPRQGSPGFRGPGGPPPGLNGWFEPQRVSFGGPRVPRGPNGPIEPRRESFGGFDNRGPPPGFQGGPPSNMFPPRGRSRSRSPPRKRDRSWERQGPPPMDGMNKQFNAPPSSYPPPSGAPRWVFEVKRGGRTRFRCLASPETLPFHAQLPLSLDIVQLPRLDTFREFLMLDRGHVRRTIYEMKPEDFGDKSGYDELLNYLLHGRDGARAGLALELERVGYKVFVLPPGMASRALGYKGERLIAVIRRRN